MSLFITMENISDHTGEPPPGGIIALHFDPGQKNTSQHRLTDL